MLCVTRIYLEHLKRLRWRTTSDVIVGVVRKQSVVYDVNQNRKSNMYGERPERTVWVRIGLHQDVYSGQARITTLWRENSSHSPYAGVFQPSLNLLYKNTTSVQEALSSHSKLTCIEIFKNNFFYLNRLYLKWRKREELNRIRMLNIKKINKPKSKQR